MKTFRKPKKCPFCRSRNIFMDLVEYKKDVWEEDTNVIISGSYFCKDCGKFISSFRTGSNDDTVMLYT